MTEIFWIISVCLCFLAPFFIFSQSNRHSILHMLPNLHPMIFIIFLIYFNTYRMMNTLYHLNIIHLTIFIIFTLCVLVFPGCWLVRPLNPQGRSRLAMCSGVRWIAETLQTAPDSTWVSHMADVAFRITAGVCTESVSVRSTIRYTWQPVCLLQGGKQQTPPQVEDRAGITTKSDTTRIINHKHKSHIGSWWTNYSLENLYWCTLQSLLRTKWCNNGQWKGT